MKTLRYSGLIALSAITLVTALMTPWDKASVEVAAADPTSGTLSYEIIYLDDASTAAARRFADTGNESWAKRSSALRALLTTAINKFSAATSETATLSSVANAIGFANTELVGIEERAMDLVRQGHDSEAAALLRGAAYEEHKHYYTNAAELAAVAIEASLSAHLERLRGRHSRLLVLCGSALILMMISLMALLVRKRAATRALRLTQIVEQSPVVVMVTDTEGRIEYVNSAFTEITEFEPDQVLGKTPRILKSGHTDPKQYEELWTTIKSGSQWSGEFHNKKRRGGRYWAAATISPLKDSHGRITGFVGMQEDITERKRAEEKKERLEIELRHAHKMESVGLLAGGIAHDFNNMLGAILGNAELALSKITGEGRLRGNLQRITEAGDRAKDLVKRILAFSRQDNTEVEPVQLAEAAREAVGLVSAAVPAMIEIRARIGTNCGLVLAERTEMVQVVMNLCTNASHAMNEAGGILTVSLCGVEVDAAFAETDEHLREGRYVKLAVADTGHGMDEATQARVYDPFFTTKPVDEGTGLGLSVVHGIVTRAGGVIMVRSAVGEGAIFEVYLPVCDEARSREDSRLTGQRVTRSGSVLLVDDETALVETAAEMLEELGYQVTALDSSIKAARVFRDHPNQFDVVVTDQAMPRMSGIALAKVMRSIRADIPIVVATGYSDVVNPDTAREHGFCGHLAKPYGVAALSAAVAEALENRSVVAENPRGM